MHSLGLRGGRSAAAGAVAWILALFGAGSSAYAQTVPVSNGPAEEPVSLPNSEFPAWPFEVGEEAQYDVTFAGLPVGRAHLRIEAVEEIRDVPAHRLSLEIKGGIPLFRMDDRTVSWLAAEPYRSLRFEEILKQGGFRRHRRWEMDFDALTTTREDWDREAEVYRPHERRRDIPIPPGALDEISYLFLIRTLPLEVGRTYQFDQYFQPDGNPVIVQVLRKERVRVRAGSFDTIVVRPIIQTDGMFGQDGQAEVYISDDEDRLIVQLKTTMSRGSLNMFLRDFDLGGS